MEKPMVLSKGTKGGAFRKGLKAKRSMTKQDNPVQIMAKGRATKKGKPRFMKVSPKMAPSMNTSPMAKLSMFKMPISKVKAIAIRE
jgi:hypothetical protein